MRGKTNIINTATDKNTINLSDEKIIEMATIKVRYDDAIYPENYDKKLKAGEEGFVEPIERFENEIDQAILDRFGIVI